MTSSLSLMRASSTLELLVLERDPKAVSEAVVGWVESGLVVRVVRGRKMRTLQATFDEVAASLQFPWYFGENMDAFDDCMADLGWLPPRSGYVIVITDPGEVLADAGADVLGWLVDSLTRACEEWARPVVRGEWWDRPAVPFHVVLQPAPGDAAMVTQRWAGAGASVLPFPG
ncbi:MULTISPECIES: barstar family protein [unclassified Frankia]|uniref:barstar family protein n=1 Tax=unclassified Frankia TaxID=2632575 RepID=UPI002AD4EDBC|nr:MULTISPECIES: barstar family protein [unclassified Frankia]